MSVETNVSREDLELIAAVLDERLAGEARSAALARIEADEAMREVFAESARFLAEEKEEAEDSRPPAARQAPARFWKVALPIAAAATLAALLLGRPGDWMTRPASDYTKRLAKVGELPEGWATLPGQTRGSRQSGSFGLGIDVVQLELCLLKRDIETGRTKAASIEHTLADPTSDLFAPEAEDAARQLVEDFRSTAKPQVLVEKALQLDRINTRELDPLHYALGKWAEAGRLAAKLGQVAVFDREFRSVAKKAADHRDLDPDVKSALVALEGGLQEEPAAGDVSKLEKDFDYLIEAASK